MKKEKKSFKRRRGEAGEERKRRKEERKKEKIPLKEGPAHVSEVPHGGTFWRWCCGWAGDQPQEPGEPCADSAWEPWARWQGHWRSASPSQNAWIAWGQTCFTENPWNIKILSVLLDFSWVLPVDIQLSKSVPLMKPFGPLFLPGGEVQDLQLKLQLLPELYQEYVVKLYRKPI